MTQGTDAAKIPDPDGTGQTGHRATSRQRYPCLCGTWASGYILTLEKESRKIALLKLRPPHGGSGLRAGALELSRQGSCSATLSGPPLPYLQNGIIATQTLGTAPNASQRVPGLHLAFRKHRLWLLLCTIIMIGVAAFSVTFTPRGRVLPSGKKISCILSFHKYYKVQTRFWGEGTEFTWNSNACVSVGKLSSFNIDSSKEYLLRVYYVLGNVLEPGDTAATRARSLLSQSLVSARGVRK